MLSLISLPSNRELKVAEIDHLTKIFSFDKLETIRRLNSFSFLITIQRKAFTRKTTGLVCTNQACQEICFCSFIDFIYDSKIIQKAKKSTELLLL